MKPYELNPNTWKKFFARVTETHRGALITVQSLQPDGSVRPLAAEAPLQSIALDQQPDTCSDHLLIATGAPGQKPVQLSIVEPIYIRLKDGTDNRYHHIHIAAEDGTTVIHLHPGLDTELLKQLEAAPTV